MATTTTRTSKPKLLGAMSRFSSREFRRITQEMYAQNLELVQVNSTLSLLNSIDRIVLQSTSNVEESCAKITEAMAEEYSACVIAAIFRRNGNSTKTPEPLEAWACERSQDADKNGVREFLENLKINSSRNWGSANARFLEHDMTDFGKLMHVDIQAAREFSEKLGVDHYYVAKLVGSHGTIGVVMMGLQKEVIEHDTGKLLARISEAASIALDNKLLQEENEKILFRLRSSNAKLKKLDQTKDDFISMASHQLRTPLTSVKGYVSMVLDGDVGPLNSMQQKLLTQSFISAQRMAYLIADLLNLSRLKTGKFIIEPTPTNLAQITKDEVSQLIETAKSRGLELTYDKPQDFPTYMLDTVKTRQVIMNFVDNAIYYTPSGGHIHIELKDKPKTIELRVVDDGIGVPRGLQHHLFTKFYRAPNAQKARPDGTGLGLFMAKKVIVAQGGAIIYESTEGKGSVFGFSFAKSHLVLPPATPSSKF